MEEINEDQNCYANTTQRNLLLEFSKIEMIRDNFFLTGGTALSVFYIHHRISDYLDLFCINDFELGDLDFTLRKNYQNNSTKISSSKHFLSQLINNVKVDFVIDYLSNTKNREKYCWGENECFLIDNLKNITSNKLCTLVSRSEPKDFIDFYFINKNYNFDLKNIYGEAKSKDGIFEDIPTVAYQIKSNFKFINSNKELFPKLLLDFNESDFQNYYKQVVNDISNYITL